MQSLYYNDYDQLSKAVADTILHLVKTKKNALICVATGNTPIGPYKKLVEEIRKTGLDVSKLRFVGLDEWVGLNPDNEGTCHHFLHKHLFHPLGIKPSQYKLFNGMADDLSKECREMESFLAEQGPIDLMLLGIGINGHLGFNEPGTPWHLMAHVVALDAVTQSVGQQYFDKPMPLSKGITLGPAAIKASAKVLMMVNGTHKIPILKRLMEEGPSPLLPASLLKTLPQAVLMTDIKLD